MSYRTVGMSPKTDEDAERAQWSAVIEFWSKLYSTEEIGVTTWGALEPIGLEVADCQVQDPPDLRRARDLTHKAMLLIAGLTEL